METLHFRRMNDAHNFTGNCMPVRAGIRNCPCNVKPVVAHLHPDFCRADVQDFMMISCTDSTP
jgi:hypothetical protein